MSKRPLKRVETSDIVRELVVRGWQVERIAWQPGPPLHKDGSP